MTQGLRRFMKIDQYLEIMHTEGASDLFLTTGAPPSIKVEGIFKNLNEEAFSPGDVKQIVYELMDEEKVKEFEKNSDMNFGLSKKGLGRFRVNVFKQRNEVAVVIRAIKLVIPEVDSLGLPAITKELIMRKSGLILFVGSTGSGKSTSLASLIDYRNTHQSGHIITLEDPLEYLHKHKKSCVNQREIGVDTFNYESGLINALRQSPDVILVGEIRSREVMEYALTFAETGHLCLSTLHAQNANQAIERIINFFRHDRHQQLLLDLAINLAAIISQRLIITKTGDRVAIFETLLITPLIADLIKANRVEEIKDIMQKSEAVGMSTFNSGLFSLYQKGLITEQEALSNSDSPNNLRLKISLTNPRSGNGSGVSIQKETDPGNVLGSV
jgi:twitching motility protein PilU